MFSTTVVLENSGLHIGGGPSKTNKTKEVNAEAEPPTVNTIIPSQLNSQLDLQIQKETINLVNERKWPIHRYPSSICPSALS